VILSRTGLEVAAERSAHEPRVRSACNELFSFSGHRDTSCPKRADMPHTSTAEIEFYWGFARVQLIRKSQ